MRKKPQKFSDIDTKKLLKLYLKIFDHFYLSSLKLEIFIKLVKTSAVENLSELNVIASL